MIGPALALLLELTGQEAAAAPLAEKPVYSLVVANLTGSFRTDQRACGPTDILCDYWSIAGFDQARVLFGAPIADRFSAYLVLHVPERQVPSLLVVATTGTTSQIVARSRGQASGDPGCVRRMELPEGWLPTGAGITVSDDVICASLAGIKTEPLPVINVPINDLAKSRRSKK